MASECKEGEGDHDPIGIASPVPPLSLRTPVTPVSETLSETLQLTAGLHTPHGPGSIREIPTIHNEVGCSGEQVRGERRERGQRRMSLERLAHHGPERTMADTPSASFGLTGASRCMGRLTRIWQELRRWIGGMLYWQRTPS